MVGGRAELYWYRSLCVIFTGADLLAEQVAMICNEISRSLLHWIKCDFDRRLALAAMV